MIYILNNWINLVGINMAVTFIIIDFYVIMVTDVM